MTVQELLEKLRDYPRDMEVVILRANDTEVGDDDKVYDVNKLRMKEIVSDEFESRVATDFDFDEDRETTLAVVLYPEV